MGVVYEESAILKGIAESHRKRNGSENQNYSDCPLSSENVASSPDSTSSSPDIVDLPDGRIPDKIVLQVLLNIRDE
jgi:hypothetical protein